MREQTDTKSSILALADRHPSPKQPASSTLSASTERLERLSGAPSMSPPLNRTNRKIPPSGHHDPGHIPGHGLPSGPPDGQRRGQKSPCPAQRACRRKTPSVPGAVGDP